MKTVKTEHDGWDCLPNYSELIKAIKDGDFSRARYELFCCCRECSLSDLKKTLLAYAERLKKVVEEIDEDIEYITIKED